MPSPDFDGGDLNEYLPLHLAKAGRFEHVARYLSDPAILRRRLLIATDAEEGARRAARQAFLDFVGWLAEAWPKDLRSAGLWKIIEELIAATWPSASTDWDYDALIIWDDIGRPANLSQSPRLRNAVIRYKEWHEGILLLATAVDLASLVVAAHSELIPNF